MHLRPHKVLSWITLAVLCAGLLVLVTVVAARDHRKDYKVYVAFGFHVNLYHSFRNDTNDEHGFGKDIRIIRHIINTLDRYNEQGVPVRGVWDFDNLFSLQERLPRFAPDIISNIQRRVARQGDEVILMSYNNGLVSAMTQRELTDAMRWAVSNQWGSGVEDLFGRYSPIVRPQEMMTTPGNFSIYTSLGIEAVSLYYSATPFDAFRVFSRPLTRTEAFNPITYRNPQTKEEMIVIPTYHIGDLMEHVSLRHWVSKLHRLQQKGEINHNVLIYINYDADSEFWGGLNLKWPLDQLPNTGGLAGLIEEVKNIEYIEFTTLHNYLKTHPPVGTFTFGQDTADGSFDGYNSWAEKSQTQAYWTRIEYHRRFDRMVQRALEMINDASIESLIRPVQDDLYLKRMRALSTTNFGMATPYLAPGREAAMAELLDSMDMNAREIESLLRSALRTQNNATLFPVHLPDSAHWLDTLFLSGLQKATAKGNGTFLNIHLPESDINHRRLSLMNPDGEVWPATVVHQSRTEDNDASNLKLFISRDHLLDDGIYYLLGTPAKEAVPRLSSSDVHGLNNDGIELKFTPDGKVAGLFINGALKLAPGSLTPYFRYQDTMMQPGKLQVVPFTHSDGVATVHLRGHWTGPQSEAPPGWIDYQFTVVDGLPYLFINGQVTYPSTVKDDIFKSGTPALARRTDWDWQEAAPMELRLVPRTLVDQPVRILKHNFLGISSDYPLDYYQHSKENLSLDNINNHITAAFFGMVADGSGVAVAMDTHVAANFAFAPVKVQYDRATAAFSIKANPFGTYHGKQYRHPTWGNRQGYEMAMITGEQFHSAGPTYNGQSLSFAAMLAFFDEDEVPSGVKQDMIRYSRSPEVLSLIRWGGSDPTVPPSGPPFGLEAFYEDNGVHFRWAPWKPDTARYRVLCGEQSGAYDRTFTSTGHTLMAIEASNGIKFKQNQVYYAVVEALTSNGEVSARSDEIVFFTTRSNRDSFGSPRLSLGIKLKILWANISAYLSRYAI